MIELKNIHKHFKTNHVLKGINLEVNKGDVLVIIGPSGSGKTTLLRCINYLERPDEGQISVDGFSVQGKHPSKHDILTLRRKTAMVFQHYNLFKNKTVLENVMEGLVVAKKMTKSEAKEISLALLEKVGLAEKVNDYPSQLSGGQQQRVGIARALALNPSVILFDEPTSALDPEMVGEVLAIIKQIASEGITMVIVTHEIDFARDAANRVVFMDDGVIVEQGHPQEVLVQPKHERLKQFLKRLVREPEYLI
ncbi:amino acid ABC transporter ATP-binding protein [Cytobacillus depressus]|uniref:Amino acid ABC transporter ATP-binding protein n=1 Tax=Cytobacillus depressus TaxID=1602942 RepID=A0A6L3V1E1_9BACI|nr:amino acid ABC transporter ATP-binding protein [Cytobacillus depressus]KAB2330008.1 amino acid ABC transporter ATP-binding protein [Cytobacillus depressus]